MTKSTRLTLFVVVLSLLSLTLMLGCVVDENTVVPPFTLGQAIRALFGGNADLNSWVSGDYNSMIPLMDGNKLKFVLPSDLNVSGGGSSFDANCPIGEVLRQLDSNGGYVCVAASAGSIDTNWETSWDVFDLNMGSTYERKLDLNADINALINPRGYLTSLPDFDLNYLRLDTSNDPLTGELSLRTGSTTAGTAPLKFTSGALMTTPEKGAMEYNTDDLYFTIDSSTGYVSQYPPEQTATYVKATSFYSGSFYPYFATDPTKSVIGSYFGNAWISANGASTNQAFHIDLGSAKEIKRIYYENLHSAGANSQYGVYHFTLWGSDNASAFADTTYATDTNWTEITGLSSNIFIRHPASDIADPQYITISTSPNYRYYRFKFADNYAGATFIGVRRIELQTAGTNVRSGIVLTNGSNLTSGRVPYATTNGRLTDSSTLTYSATSGLASTKPILLTGSSDTVQFKILGNSTQTANLMDVFASDGTTPRLHLKGDGKVGIGTTAPTAKLHLPAGSSTANTAPLKFTSGNLLSTTEAGAIEFLTDNYYATITTQPNSRKGIVLNDGTNLVAGRVPFATTNGRLTDSNLMTFDGNGLHLDANIFFATGKGIVYSSIIDKSSNVLEQFSDPTKYADANHDYYGKCSVNYSETVLDKYVDKNIATKYCEPTPSLWEEQPDTCTPQPPICETKEVCTGFWIIDLFCETKEVCEEQPDICTPNPAKEIPQPDTCHEEYTIIKEPVFKTVNKIGYNAECRTEQMASALSQLNKSINLTSTGIDTTEIFADSIYTKSKVPDPLINYCKMINDANIYNKAQHYAYKLVNEKYVLDAEYRWLVLEGCEKQKLAEMCIINKKYSWCK